MYDIDNAAKAAYATDAARPDKRPLTNEIMGNTSEHLDLARQVNQRLYELRDRLFGSAPPSGEVRAGGANAPANSFSEAYTGTARELYNTLSLIDGVSMELASRL